MARLRRASPVESEDSEDLEFIQDGAQLRKRGAANAGLPKIPPAKPRSSPRKKDLSSYREPVESKCNDSDDSRTLTPRLPPRKAGEQPKQIRLAPLSALSVPRSLQLEILDLERSSRPIFSAKTQSPKKPVAQSKLCSTGNRIPTEDAESVDSTIEIDVEESVWCGSDASSSDSEEDLPSPRKFVLPRKSKPEFESGRHEASSNSSIPGPFKDSKISINEGCNKSAKPRPTLEDVMLMSSRPTSSSDKENSAAFLRFSPPRLHSPAKRHPQERAVTPPQSPSKSCLQSPSKTKVRIPTPPYRQSLDAFWNADTVNDWNEQHSPKKVLKSPKKLKFLQGQSQDSPTSSPRKAQSPSKRTKAEIEAKKDFESRKHCVAQKFLGELDRVVTHGKIYELAASTGGVHFVWSKTLNSTAGRANWRRETTKTSHLDGSTTTIHKHHASIELAEKVIDNEDRLVNVIAHEFCHLANFMVSGIKDQPHGRQFKEWGRKCTAAFGDRGVNVTTKHTFEIEYKHVWQCSNEECAVEFKRHSKSIDPKRHTCGSCRSKLVQIKPIPRKVAGNGTGYAAYVKKHFAEVRKGLPGASQKDIMEAVARKYRAEKEGKGSSPSDGVADEALDPKLDVNNVIRKLEFISLDDV